MATTPRRAQTATGSRPRTARPYAVLEEADAVAVPRSPDERRELGEREERDRVRDAEPEERDPGPLPVRPHRNRAYRQKRDADEGGDRDAARHPSMARVEDRVR